MSKKRVTQGKSSQKLFDEGDTIDVLSLFGALRRRKWLIALIALLGTAAAGLYGMSLTPTYTAQASVLIETSENPVADMRTASAGLTPDIATITTQIRILQSPTYHARVMEELGLFNDAEFNPLLRKDGGLFDGNMFAVLEEPIDQLISFLPDKWLIATGLADEDDDAPGVALAPQMARQSALNRFAKNLKLANDGLSHLIFISYTSEDPEKAARIANRTAEVYVDEQVKMKELVRGRNTSFLQDRITQLKEEVRMAEEAVANYRTQNNLSAATGGLTLSDQGLSDLTRQLIEAEGELADREARLAQINDLRARGLGLEALSQIAASPVVTALRQQEAELLRLEAELTTQYGERHPEMVRVRNERRELQGKIAAEIETVVRGLQSDAQVARARVAVIERQLGTLKSQSDVDQASGVRLGELERQATVARTLYEEFLRSAQENRELMEIVQPDARIVAQATAPTSPSSPGEEIFAVAGLIVSFIGGSLVAIVLDRMDRGLRSAKEVERLLGLPTLGLVPLLDKLKKNQKPYQYLMDKPLSAYTEAIRGVYMAIKLSKVDAPPKVILVTSSLPQEGKTTLAVSLATFAARSHKRVLLMDLDLRHPSVHRELGWQVSGGLVEYMANERTLEEVIHHDLETGLHFLPIKGQTTNPTDLLDSQRLRLLIQSLRESYDYIVLDTAPLASVTDTRVAAFLADRVLFAVRWGATVISAAEDSIQTLRDVDIEPAGAVLTQVDMKKHAQYGYADVGEYYSQSQKYYVN